MNVRNDPHASYALLKKEFERRGYSVAETVGEDGVLRVTYTSPTGKSWRIEAKKIIYPSTTYQLGNLSENKPLAYQYVKEKGIRVPETQVLKAYNKQSVATAEELLSKYPRLVVKPANASLSNGLTTDITSASDLVAAFERARAFSPEVIIQEQVIGEEVRFVVMKGSVVAASLRQAPQVIGDGTSTIEALIDQENDARRSIASSMVEYPQLTRDMLENVDWTSIPQSGEIVKLGKATMVREGASIYSVLEEVHQSYIDIVKQIVDGFETELLVVDVMIADYTQPATEDNYAFIEFNTAPVLKLFYSCRDGKHTDLIPSLVSSIDQSLHTPAQQVVGSFESVKLPELSDVEVFAKVDTGAYSGAVHCTGIRVVRQNGVKKVRFHPYGVEDTVVEAELYDTSHVRSSTGHRVKRYLIETTIVVNNKSYPIIIGLSDRTDLKFEVLLGRRFLREQNILVDTRINQHLDSDGERT